MIDAPEPLLVAGLHRAATLVGIDRTTNLLEADLTLRSPGAGPPHPRIDIECNGVTVVLTMTATPPTELWLRVRDLVGHLTSLAGGVAEKGAFVPSGD